MFPPSSTAISSSLASEALVARIDGSQLWDLSRPLERDCSLLEILKFDDEKGDGRSVLWHSSAHILGEALERKFGEGTRMCDGPPLIDTDGGFYYDFYFDPQVASASNPADFSVSEKDFAELDRLASEIIASNQTFERLEVSRDLARRMFSYNKMKLEIIDSIPENEPITLYRCGDLVDLCRGPHIPTTGLARAFNAYKVSGAYWMGDTQRERIQRVYGIAFPTSKQLKQWNTQREEAAKRDHRVIGKAQELFMFHEYSPGSVFLNPHGTRIYNRLVNYLRREYRQRGYEEVMSPLIFNKNLWVTSGHWQNYKQDMFVMQEGASPTHQHQQHDTDPEASMIGLKPMNCPGHCLMFAQKVRSYRELPIRWADFSSLHRNEAHGALSGLTRVRRFHQDDSHIFCTKEQATTELMQCLEFVKQVYSKFGLTDMQLRLSTRPEQHIGDTDSWDEAERQLRAVLEQFVQQNPSFRWQYNPGDGAFYGPKIDVQVRDAINRLHQCATVQLDFQLPQRFHLHYHGNDDSQQHSPVLIHRAIMGSIERFMALIMENFAGKWPFWLSPRQAIVLCVSDAFLPYAHEVGRRLRAAESPLAGPEGFYVDVDTGAHTLSKKVREAQLMQYNLIVVVGEREFADKTVNVRARDGSNLGVMTVEQLISEFQRRMEHFE